MRLSWSMCLPAVILAWLPQSAPAASDPSLAPQPSSESAAALPEPSAPATPPVVISHEPGCPTAWGFVGYGFEPARGLTVYGPGDNAAGLMWQGYVGHLGQWDLGPVGACGAYAPGCRR
jgi:hypothetical protein